jgi:hypothetical protein
MAITNKTTTDPNNPTAKSGTAEYPILVTLPLEMERENNLAADTVEAEPVPKNCTALEGSGIAADLNDGSEPEENNRGTANAPPSVSIEERKNLLKAGLKGLQESKRFRSLTNDELQRIKLIELEIKELSKVPKELKIFDDRIEVRQISAKASDYELFSKYVDFCLEREKGKQCLTRAEMEAAIISKIWIDWFAKKFRFKTWLKEQPKKKPSTENSE